MANLAFAGQVNLDQPLQARIQAEKAKRAENIPTVPTTIEKELATNPFLRCNDAAIKKSAEIFTGHKLQTQKEVFAAVRQWKDSS